ncbi:MarR family transcriptional regulator [Phytomonospora sp. NPDC050363]|uniref:MarR family winged helix-turn-helix transcriptional regulator n=1 Tax=Phytomonospora sp. NPDC050363 TaxID=3155642 RepID=UPI0033E385DC
MSEERDYELWTDLVALHGRVEQRLAAVLLRQHSLGLSEYRALCHLAKSADGELRMQELAELTGLNQSSVTRLVHRLEKAGLARRTHCAQDRRGVYTEITPDGRELQARALPVYSEELSLALDESAAAGPLAATVVRLRAE